MPVVVLGSSQAIPINQDQPAPVSGWLLTDSALVELLECCGDTLELPPWPK